MDGGQGIVVQIFALVLAVCFHEAAHGWVAWRNGDPTAKLAGRITLNPIPHIDLFGTILFPAILMITHAPILIGWAKPVPVNPRNFTNPKRGFSQVSIAGPGSNMLLAVIAAIALKIWTTLEALFLEVAAANAAGTAKASAQGQLATNTARATDTLMSLPTCHQ